MNELERILHELAGITERLIRTPEHAFEERAKLQARQEQLRAEAARLRERTAATSR